MTKLASQAPLLRDYSRTNLGFAEFLWLWGEAQGQLPPPLHVEIALWLEEAWQRGDRNLLLMAFRGAGKSTIAALYSLWLIWQHPNLRIMVIAAEQELANKLVRNIRRLLEKHPLTKALKPSHPEEWAADRFSVKRSGAGRDPTLLGRGITANLTGSRAEIIILDDVEVPNNSDSRERRADLRRRLSEIDYIMTPQGQQLYIGTPHAWHSIYAETPRLEEGEDIAFLDGFHRLKLPILNPQGQSRWPERFPLAMIDKLRLRHGQAKFSSQMMLQPVSWHEMRLNPDLLIPYEAEPELRIANQTQNLWLDGRMILSASAWWDPAYGANGGDGSAVAIVYTDEQGHFFLHHLDYLTPRPQEELDNARQQCRMVGGLAAEFHLPSITLEANGLGRFLPELLKQELREMGLSVAVVTNHSRQNKVTRILEALDAPLAAGQIHCHRKVLAGPLVREMREWLPLQGSRSGQKDDALDALAGAIGQEPVRLARFPQTEVMAKLRKPGRWRQGGSNLHDSQFNPLQ